MNISFINIARKHFLNLFRKRYKIGNYNIFIPFNHKLPIHQSLYKLYDQFLIKLSKNLDEAIIDIGANIGDTLLSMIQANRKVRFLCVEGFEFLFFLFKKKFKLTLSKR